MSPGSDVEPAFEGIGLAHAEDRLRVGTYSFADELHLVLDLQAAVASQHGVEAFGGTAGEPFEEHACAGRMVDPQVAVGAMVLGRVLVSDVG